MPAAVSQSISWWAGLPTAQTAGGVGGGGEGGGGDGGGEGGGEGGGSEGVAWGLQSIRTAGKADGLSASGVLMLV